MDSLAQMLTDPLDSGMDTDGCVMEECMLGNCRVRIPEDFLEDPEIFFSVISESTWSEVLTDAQRQHLRQLLPHFPENNISEQDNVISDLFNNQNFCFGNPLHLAQKLFRDGYFNPEVVKYRQLCAKSQRKRHIYSLQQYYHKLLKQILVSRKELLDLAVRSGPELSVKRRYTVPSHKEVQEQRVRHRVGRILREVKTECGDSNVSSDDDDTTSWLPVPPPPSSPTPTVSLRVLPSLSTQDMKTRDKTELGEKDLRAMLRRHREKRKQHPDHPDLMTSDLQLGDIMLRVNIGRKGSVMALSDLALPKKKMREEKRKRKMRPIKSESEDGCDGQTPTASMATNLSDNAAASLQSVKEDFELSLIGLSYFFLLLLFSTDPWKRSRTIEEKVQQWQNSPASALNPWFSLASCWSELVVPALQFLAGENKCDGFTPYHIKITTYSVKQDPFRSLLFVHFVLFSCGRWTDYVVRPSTEEERHVFQEQEQQRYDQPHKAFTFRMHGFESVVGPVKGVFDKETSLNKAREHSLLRSDRPAYVTILSLVRDAAARLPNGEGTRAEICELLKDSQFLAPDVTSAQVNTVVSGALDRLHYEKDPCVKYDIGRKLWIYLHRDRSQEEFERIHQAQAAAAKARKALQQKPKPTPKPVSTLNLPVLSPVFCSVLLVSPPSMPQLGTLLSASQVAPQASQQASVQPAARVVAHSATAGSLPQVRVVTAQPGLPAASTGQAATLVHQTPHHIRVPVTVAHSKGIAQVRSPIQVQASRAQTTLSVPGLASAVAVTKTQTSSPGSPAQNTASPTVLQGVTSQNIIKQVAITGQLGVKAQNATGIPLTATNLRIQGKDVLRLPPSSITTDAKGQTVLRITPEMMATLKLTPDMLGSATSTTAKGISGLAVKGSSSLGPLVKVHPELKATCDTAIRLMPALAVTVADPKTRTFSTVTSSDSKAGGTTIRIVPNLGVIPQKQGQTVTVNTTSTSTKPVTASSGAATVTIATSGVAGAKGVTLGPAAAGSPLSLGTAAATVRQVPVSATVVATQQGKLPARITVPLSVLSQPLKSKSVVTSPILKGSISTNISNLGRNIILTTMPAGTRLIAGNKPVSFVTAQQLQQLQQQGQATQVRIQTVPAQQLQQRSAASSPKSTVSTVVVSTTPSPKTAPDPQ
uniref:DEUBAD domain-containing protein n=1 Tax=Pygocentrus nattereri TaxID=42514 RepID=A0AAR2INZ3_PYGNA